VLFSGSFTPPLACCCMRSPGGGPGLSRSLLSWVLRSGRPYLSHRIAVPDSPRDFRSRVQTIKYCDVWMVHNEPLGYPYRLRRANAMASAIPQPLSRCRGRCPTTAGSGSMCSDRKPTQSCVQLATGFPELFQPLAGDAEAPALQQHPSGFTDQSVQDPIGATC